MAETTGLIEQYAQHLESRASGLVLRFSVLGALFGAALGGFPLFQGSNAVVPHRLAYATLLLGAVAGAYLGWSLGERRAVDLRFQAQLALRQLQVEQALMRGALMRPAAPAPVPVPVPVSAPAPAPAVAAPAPAAAVAAPEPVSAPPAAPMPAAVRPPAPAPLPVEAPPAVQVAPAPLPVAPPVAAGVEEELAPPPALAPAPPRLVQPPLSSTGA